MVEEEDVVVVVMVVRVTDTGMAAVLTDDRKEKDRAAKATRVAHLEKVDQVPSPASGACSRHKKDSCRREEGSWGWVELASRGSVRGRGRGRGLGLAWAVKRYLSLRSGYPWSAPKAGLVSHHASLKTGVSWLTGPTSEGVQG